jgi:hypothetical protein
MIVEHAPRKRVQGTRFGGLIIVVPDASYGFTQGATMLHNLVHTLLHRFLIILIISTIYEDETEYTSPPSISTRSRYSRDLPHYTQVLHIGVPQELMRRAISIT